MSDINLDEDLITSKLLGLKKHKSMGNNGLVPRIVLELACADNSAVSFYLISDESVKDDWVPAEYKDANVMAIYF